MNAHSSLIAVCMVLASSGMPAHAAEQIPVPGPQLDPVPGPAITSANLPAPATWPILRYERPLRILAILSKRQSTAPLQRIARRMRASLEIRYVGGGDDRYHVNDKWIEPKGDPTKDELLEFGTRLVLDATSFEGDRPPYDVIFCNWNLEDPTLQANLIKFMNAGGVLAACGSVYPKVESPLGRLWPAKPTPRNSWMGGGATRTDARELAGVPVQYLAGHTWIPIPEAAEGAGLAAL